MFSYDPVHQVIICQACQSCVVPGARSQERHLRAPPHRLVGEALRATLQQLRGYQLRTVEELKQSKPQLGDSCPALPYLATYQGLRCLQVQCGFKTRQATAIQKHVVTAHQIKAASHCARQPLWQACQLQTYFTSGGRIDYFEVTGPAAASDGQGSGSNSGSRPLTTTTATATATATATTAQQALFASIEQDARTIQQDVDREAAVIQDLNASRTERVPWLEKTGFPAYLAGLQDSQIKSAYKLPSKDPAKATDNDRDLARILAAMQALLDQAYQLCNSTSPDCKMTQQRANILNEFYTGVSGKADGFRYRKDPSTLTDYFQVWQQLLAYYWRVVRTEEDYFTTANQPAPALLPNALQPTPSQARATQDILAALALAPDQDLGQLLLQQAVRRLSLALICQSVSSTPFQSPVISFCAMLSRTVQKQAVQARLGLWQEPGNFNHYLSALTWTAQLVIFDYACFQEQEDESQIPVFLVKVCKRFFQQLAETPFGYILQ
jgi:hypothetical protein